MMNLLACMLALTSVGWNFPLRSCHEGIPFGNAESGFLVYGEGNVLQVTVGRDDTWDHRGGYDWHEEQSYTNIVAALKAKDGERMRALFRRGEMKPGEPTNPQIIPVGRYVFTMSDGVRLVSGRLDTGTGLASVSLSRGEASAGELLIALDRASGVLSIRWPSGVSASCEVRPAWKKEMRSNNADRPLRLDPPVRFAVEGGSGFAQPLPADPFIGSGYATANGESAIVAVRGNTAAEAEGNVADRLSKALKTGYAATAASSTAFWRGWWRESPVIDVPDGEIREIHDFGMYKFGSMAGADGVPVPLQGPWIEDYRLPPWHGDYHFNINVQLCYWPAFRGNHLEALMPLFRMIRGWRPVLRENARKFAGVEDGFMLPHSVDDRCRLIGGYWAGTMDFVCTPWICQMMMRYVRMSGDRAFLASDAYPLMKGSFNVLRALMADDGAKLSYPVSTSPEFDANGGWGRNSSFALAATHRLAADLVEAAELLGETPDPRWLDVRSRLPLASFAGGKPGGEIELWEGLDLPESHRHHSHLAGYVPFDVWGWKASDGSDPMYASAQRTVRRWQVHGMGLWAGWSMGWASMLQTCFGQAESAALTLHVWNRTFTNPGHGSRHDVYNPGFSVMRRGRNASRFDVAGDAPDEEIMQIDGAMACTAAVQEMMVCDIGGVTHVFRGAPARWRDCSFRNVLSDAGVLVSAVRRGGEVQSVELFSRRGGKMRLQSPWRQGETLDVALAPGETRLLNPPPRSN